MAQCDPAAETHLCAVYVWVVSVTSAAFRGGTKESGGSKLSTFISVFSKNEKSQGLFQPGVG